MLLSGILTGCFLFSSSVYAEEKTYIFGIVPQFETRRLHNIWRPVLAELEKETGYHFDIKGSSSIPDFEKEFINGDFDFAYMNPYHAIMANSAQNYQPLVRDIDRKLFGVLVVKKDSKIFSVPQLNGKKIAFPAPNALGASLQMRQELNDIFHIKFEPRYVKTHDSVYLNVLLGETLAGGGVQKTLNRQPSEYKDALRILHKTTPVNPHPLTVHPRVPEQVRDAVRASLLKLGQTPEGSELLAKIPIRKIGAASIEDYAPLKELKLERFYIKK